MYLYIRFVNLFVVFTKNIYFKENQSLSFMDYKFLSRYNNNRKAYRLFSLFVPSFERNVY